MNHQDNYCPLRKLLTSSVPPLHTLSLTGHATEQQKMTTQWTTYRDTPEDMRRGSAVTHDKMAYFNPRGSTNVYQFDAEKDDWRTLPNCPHYYSAMAVVNGQITTIGGSHGRYRGVATNSLASLTGEGEDRKWVEHLPRMPTSRYALAAVTTGRTLVAAGGHDGERRVSTVEVLDMEDLQWSLVRNLPRPMDWASITVCGDQLYLLGGEDQNGRGTRSVFTCSISELMNAQEEKPTNQLGVWHEAADVPHYRSTVATVGHLIVAIGGQSTAGENTSAIVYYDITCDRWQDIGHMSTPRWLPLVTVLPSNKVIVAGGWGGWTKVEVGKIVA